MRWLGVMVLAAVGMGGIPFASAGSYVEPLTLSGWTSPSGLPEYVNSDSFRVTLDAGRTGVQRLEIRHGYLGPFPPTGSEKPLLRTVYYDPPAPIENGAFEAFFPGQPFGMLLGFGAIAVSGVLDSDESASGTIQMVTGGDSPVYDWHVDTPIELRPGPDDRAIEARLHEGAGSLTLFVDQSGAGLTAFHTAGIPMEGCAGKGNTLDIDASFDPSVPLANIDDTPFGLRIPMRVEGRSLELLLHLSVLGEGIMRGSLVLGDYDTCGDNVEWTVGDMPLATPQSTLLPDIATPTASPTPKVVVLPPSGGAARSDSSLPLGVALLAAGTALLALGRAAKGRTP